MSDDYHKHALEEILGNIKNSDLIKARIVIAQFSNLSASEKRRILFEVNRCDDAFALPLLVSILVADAKNRTAYPSLEESIMAKAVASPTVVLTELTRESAEQYYYARLCGKICLEEAKEQLNKLLLSTNNTKVIKECMKTLGLIGSPLAVNSISEFLTSGEPPLAYQAIQSLGQIATPTAIKRLSELLGSEKETDMLILDIFARVQDEISLHKLNDTLRSRSSHLRNYSKQKFVEIGAKALPLLAENLDRQDVDLQIHSLNLLTEIGDESSVLTVRRLLQGQPADANVRFAAYEAMAALPRRKGDYVLAGGLNDQVDDVRLAAAQAIDTNLDEVMLAGITNMVSRGDAEATRIIKAVIDAKTKNLFLGLTTDSFFTEIAVQYLATKAHPEIKNTYITLLREHDMAGFADQITTLASSTQKNQLRGKICVVDDSQMILNIYRRILNDLDYEPVLFQYPAEALKWLQAEKPLALCTDLNMPDITGVELTRRAREKYSKDELPIIMVTTQDDPQDHQSAFEAGVTIVMSKPFDIEKPHHFLNHVLEVNND